MFDNQNMEHLNFIDPEPASQQDVDTELSKVSSNKDNHQRDKKSCKKNKKSIASRVSLVKKKINGFQLSKSEWGEQISHWLGKVNPLEKQKSDLQNENQELKQRNRVLESMANLPNTTNLMVRRSKSEGDFQLYKTKYEDRTVDLKYARRDCLIYKGMIHHLESDNNDLREEVTRLDRLLKLARGEYDYDSLYETDSEFGDFREAGPSEEPSLMDDHIEM